jgi:C-terminal processing protease CtpA/Prc
MKKAEGAIVEEPQAGSPAAKAGIMAGDVITAVDSTPVHVSAFPSPKKGPIPACGQLRAASNAR